MYRMNIFKQNNNREGMQTWRSGISPCDRLGSEIFYTELCLKNIEGFNFSIKNIRIFQYANDKTPIKNKYYLV